MKKEYWDQVAEMFTMSLLAVTIVGESVRHFFTAPMGLYELGRGLTFHTILQIFLFSVIGSGIRIFFLNGRRMKRMSYLMRVGLMVFSIFGLTILFVLIFRWFPVSLPEAWIGFVISFLGSVSVCLLVMSLIYRRKGKHYGELLDKYKEGKLDGRDH